ncbi:MAG: hypothetical protein ACRD3C_03945 [Vicinamibacterales bacterium]
MNISRRRFADAADAVFAALIALILATEITGGFREEIYGLRISITSPWRILAWAVVVAVVRHLVVPRPSLLSRVRHSGVDVAPLGIVNEGLGIGAPRRALRFTLLLVFFTALTAWILLPQLLAPFSVPDHGDPLLSIWRLSWVAHQLPRDPMHLFDANIFHPHVRTLAFSDAMLLPAMAAAPVLWLGMHQVLVYQLLLFACIVLSGVTMFLLVRTLTARSDAALVAGLLFAFCAFRFGAHYSHLELQVTFWMPLGLLWFHRAIATYRWRDGLLTGLVVALQGLSSLYYGLFFSILLVCLTVILWVIGPHSGPRRAERAKPTLSTSRGLCGISRAEPVPGYVDIRRAARPLLAGALLAAAVLVPTTIPYWQNRSVLGERPEDEVREFSAVPADYLVPHGRSVYPRARPGDNPERELFPGLVPVALAAIGLAPPLSAVRLAYLGGLVLAVDASFGLDGAVYWYLYRYVLPFRGLRAPARFAVIVALTLSVLAGFGVARIARRVTRPMLQRALVVGLALLALVEARPVLSLEPLWRQPPRVYAALPGGRASVLAEFPLPSPDGVFGDDFRYMYFSTFHWNRLINGATGFLPEGYLAFRKLMREFPSDRAIRVLRARGVEFLTVHGRFYESSEFARVTADLDRRSSLRLVTVDQWEGSEVRLYRLEREDGQ